MSPTKFVNTYNIIHENQAGFRKKYSTADHSFTMKIQHFWHCARFKLFQKLVGYNIVYKLVDYRPSSRAKISYGKVKLFSRCSFSLFINNLNEYLQQSGNTGIEIEYNDAQIIKMLRSHVLLFADDTVLFATTPEQLRQRLSDFNT